MMVLGDARRLSVEFPRDQQVATLVACHEHVLDWFGGFTEERLYDNPDNPKTVVLKRDRAGRVMSWNPLFGDFARSSGVTTPLYRPYRAQTKGKGASGVKYVKRRVVLGQAFPHWAALNSTGHARVTCVADQRLHGATVRKPAEAVAEEHLRSHLGQPPYVLQARLLRTGAREGLVTVETNPDAGPAAYEW